MENQDDILRTFERWKVANPDSQPTMLYRKPSFKKRQQDIGVVDNFEFYMYQLNCCNFSNYWKKNGKSDWYQVKRADKAIPLTKYAVLAHLEGKSWISRALPLVTNLFAIDLDYKGSRKELTERYNNVTDILPNPVVFQSSKSKGLHLYWFFKSLRCTENVAQRLKFFLDSNNLIVESGILETFPGICHHLRLPLGRDSFLLNNKSLKSLDLNLHNSIEFIRANIGNGEILFSFTEINSREFKKTKPIIANGSNRRIESFVYMESTTTNIVAEPIIEYGTRNNRQLELIRFYANKGYSEEEVFKHIMQWYRSDQHKSKDWEQNPIQVEKGLRSAIQNWFTKMHCQKIIIKGTLTLAEIKYIMDRAMQQKRFINIGHKEFKLLKFIFHLLLHYKSKPTRNVNLAYKTIIKIPGTSSRTEADFIQDCINIGLIEKIAKHNRYLGKSSTYLLHFAFQDEKGVKSFEEGLLQLYSRSDLYKMFKRSTYERIIRYKPHVET